MIVDEGSQSLSDLEYKSGLSVDDFRIAFYELLKNDELGVDEKVKYYIIKKSNSTGKL